MIRFATLLAVLVLITGQAARAATCACAPCPLEAGGTCRPEPALKDGEAFPSGPKSPCCGEPEPEASCSCAHIAAPEGVPPGIDVITSVATIEAAIPVAVVFEDFEEVVAVTPRGPGPPRSPVPLFLRDLSLRH